MQGFCEHGNEGSGSITSQISEGQSAFQEGLNFLKLVNYIFRALAIYKFNFERSKDK